MAARTVKDAKDLDTNELIYFKSHAKATYMSNGTTVEDAINNLSISIPPETNSFMEITYSELKTLLDNSELVPGMSYRITDYVTTTTEENTKAANHQFDIIVTANDVNVLSHLAKAAKHKNVTYFDSCDIESWQLWYDINNNTDKYAWADVTNGKGVIYRMIDDNNNDCPYDFKNILFYTDKYTEHPTSDNYYYTFSYIVTGILYDCTVDSQIVECHNNSMKEYLKEYSTPPYVDTQYLNQNIFINTEFSYNPSCYSNTFGRNCYLNIFGGSCYLNTFGENCDSNILGDLCSSNTFGDWCYSNTLGNYCSSNNFKEGCESNTFGEGCASNILGDYCESNTFGESCYSNVLGYCSYSNTFGDDCESNILGDYCDSNILGNNCEFNTFGAGCYSNTFGYKCTFNTFGNGCESNTFGEDTNNPKSYYKYIVFDNGNKNINLNCTGTTSSNNYYQNVKIGLGVNNTRTTKTITDSNTGQNYETYYKPANSQTITV
jgi:hypothetical protein